MEYITVLPLRAIQQTWHVEYKQTLSSQLRHSVCIGEKINTLTLYGDVKDISKTHVWLQKWLRQLAKTHLIPWIESLSIRHQLLCNKITIRAQQTLWGSCNRQRNISLNYKLLFIPAKQAQHIMLHELCHIKHLNHSKRFWDLLSKLDPDCEANNNAVREGDQFVPQWL